MKRILANDGITESGKKALEKAGFEVVTENVPQENLIEELQNYDAVLVRSATKIRKDVIDACSNISLIGRGGVGMDNIDVDYAKKKGIEIDLKELSGFIDAATTAAAEHITSMLKDVLSKRKTEIGSFNEAVAIEAERLGLDAPVNKTVGLLMRIIEKTYERQVFKT